MEKPSRIELVERADRAIATAKLLMQQFAWAIDQSTRSMDDSRRVRISQKLGRAAFAKIGRIVEPVREPDFDGFDANIAETERVPRLARECGFSDLVEKIQKDIAAMLQPDITIFLGSTDGERQAWIAARHKQLREMLGVVEDG